jgi:hypothetical protein
MLPTADHRQEGDCHGKENTACVAFIGLAATPYSQTADALLITIRLTLLIAISVLVIRERWRHSHDSHASIAPPSSQDVGSTFLRRFRRWYHGD